MQMRNEVLHGCNVLHYTFHSESGMPVVKVDSSRGEALFELNALIISMGVMGTLEAEDFEAVG